MTSEESLEVVLDKIFKLYLCKQTFESQNREEILRAIKTFYNNVDIRLLPNWEGILTDATQAFNIAGAMQLKLQNGNVNTSGAQISEALKQLLRSAKDNEDIGECPNSLPSKPQSSSQHAARRCAKPKAGAWGIRHVNEPITPQPLDPFSVMDNSVWCYMDPWTSPAKSRIHVAPCVENSASVFVDFANDMLRKNAQTYPRKFKNTLPGPVAQVRNDRIVIYCSSDTELENGIAWLKAYQNNNAGEFDDELPREVKPVAGLKGVGISTIPEITPGASAQAGVSMDAGMGVDYSRSALAYLAMARVHLEGKVDFLNFKMWFYTYAKMAKHDF